MSSEKEKVYTPVAPIPIFQEDPRATISDAEQAMYDTVLEHFSADSYVLPNVDENGGLTPAEKFWLSRECLLRYLRATKWKVQPAITRLEVTLKWRREYGLYDTVNAAHVEPEAVTGKEILFGYDVKGKPAFYMIPSRQNTEEPTRQIQFAVWMLERGVDLMEPGVETLALLINFADKAKNPSMSTARTVLNILQEHYPERLGLALIINVPFFVKAFFKLIMPFVDPVTREKVKFNPEIIKDGLFAKDMVMSEWWGGDRDFEYVHEKYWKELVGMCEERTRRWRTRWEELGAKVGISEWGYKQVAGVDEKELAADQAGSEKQLVSDPVIVAAALHVEEEKKVEDTSSTPNAVDDSTAAVDEPSKSTFNAVAAVSSVVASTTVIGGSLGGAPGHIDPSHATAVGGDAHHDADGDAGGGDAEGAAADGGADGGE
ncbi:hypothetical protein K443DRAFT_682763 [Laccaria amethystina LaAM-08-1]|uniref:CRAL-TRIO domain-containing protein n=1 Tax=Laccaria amethystina LaAM-08-1 TaxID=1095629 RepID=A0A0C9WK41_9AGAR|nr:hypothetical protein K443DRAFT_682763 [Laccaria amethystina LaAM-08-1]